MGTNYYLADRRYMTSEQIKKAESFLDENAFVCNQSYNGERKLFSLGIDPFYLFNYPANTKIINDNSSIIGTFGELVKVIESDDSKLRMPDEVEKKDYEYIENWLKSHRDHKSWGKFIHSLDVESIFMPRKNASHYLNVILN